MRLYARLTMAGLPRGGGNGDDIRMGILHIMRDGGIKEGHRPVGLLETQTQISSAHISLHILLRIMEPSRALMAGSKSESNSNPDNYLVLCRCLLGPQTTHISRYRCVDQQYSHLNTV